jgi:hypothetical protein
MYICPQPLPNRTTYWRFTQGGIEPGKDWRPTSSLASAGATSLMSGCTLRLDERGMGLSQAYHEDFV